MSSIENTDSFRRLMGSLLPEKHSNILKGTWNGWKEMYGTKSDFMKSVEKFAEFPGSSEYFGLELAEPYITPPTKFTSTDGKAFSYKQCLFIHLQNAVNQTEIPYLKNNEFIESVVGYFLKTKAVRLEKCFEIVPLPEHIFNVYPVHLKYKLDIVPNTYNLVKKASVAQVFDILKKIIPSPHKNDPEYQSILNLVKKSNGEKPIDKNLLVYEKLLNWTSVIIEELNQFVATHPEFFMPRRQGQKIVPTVRVFNYQNDNFMLIDELLSEMEAAKMEVTEIKEKVSRIPKLWTIDEEDPFLSEITNKITFLEYEIVPCKHRASIIPSINGQYCMLGIDFLLELLNGMIFNGQFQRVTSGHWTFMNKFLGDISKKMSEITKGCRFIEINEASKLKTWCLESVKEMSTRFPTNITEVRQLDKKGFTAEKLKNEVVRLGITTSFDSEEVMDRIKYFFNHFDGIKTGKVFTTKDLYDTLRSLQLTLLAVTVPGIHLCFHKQGACTVFEECCLLCLNPAMSMFHRRCLRRTLMRFDHEFEEEHVEEGVENCASSSEEKHDGASLKAEKKKEKKRRQAEKKLVIESQKLVEKKQILEAVAVPASPSEVVGQVEAEPVSQPSSCSKCFRTSQHCESAKAKLREEKIKTKALTKQVKEAAVRETAKDKQLEEKDEEIRLLKEKLAAMEASIQRTTTLNTTQQQPSTSAEQEEDSQPIRYLAPTYKNSIFSAETRSKFNELQNLRDFHVSTEHEATKRARALERKARDPINRRIARTELVKLREGYETFFRVLDSNIALIRQYKNESLEKLAVLPDLPTFSAEFEKVYDEVVNEELADKTCPLCIEEVEDLSETIKCKCRRRYHISCAWDMDSKGFKCYCNAKFLLD